MARVNQFAKDLGINYNQAKNLINEGRSRKDGGSQILEKTMKPIKAKDGVSVAKPKSYRKALEEKAKKMDFDKNPKNVSKFLNENKTLVRRDILDEYERLKRQYNIKPKRVIKSTHGGGEVPSRKTDAKSSARKSVKRMAGGGSNTTFPDLSGDNKVTMKDVLIGRGVIEPPTQKKAGGGMPKMPKYRDGGVFRGCGAQVKGKKFKGIF